VRGETNSLPLASIRVSTISLCASVEHADVARRKPERPPSDRGARHRVLREGVRRSTGIHSGLGVLARQIAMKTHRSTGILCALLSVIVLGGIGVLGVRLRPYWVARYRGAGANLQGAALPGARLQGVDLCAATLQGADLQGADLRGANLSRTDEVVVSEHSVAGNPGLQVQDVVASLGEIGADLRGADLHDADLRSARLWGADLQGANLRRANLRHVNLWGVLLGGADLRHADLAGANLQSADLVRVHLQGANLSGADLQGANLHGVDLAGVRLTRARYNQHTRWPAGFDPRGDGAVRVE
jgi:hypothetical protein